MTTLCANHGQQLVAVFLLTALAFGSCVQPQLQQGTTTTTTHSFLIHHPTAAATHNEPMPYPAAGYRPKIPFDLPRHPKVFFPTTSMSTLMAPTEEIDINIETLDQTNVTAIPAYNYGTPLLNNNNNNSKNDKESRVGGSNLTNVYYMKVDLNITEVINAPTEHLQPPKPNAAKNFNTLDLIKNKVNVNTITNSNTETEADTDESKVGQVLVAAVDENLFSVEPQPKLNVFNRRFEIDQRQIPASTYGVPNPDIGSNVSPSTSHNDNEIALELELNESENELAKIFIPNSM